MQSNIVRVLAALALGVGVSTFWNVASAAEGQAWLNNSIEVSRGSWAVALSHELRTTELDYQDTILQNASIGLSRRLPHGLSLGLFYKREKERTATGSRIEDRPYVELGWGRRLRPRLQLSTRLRTELRRFRRDARNDVLRFRFRVRLSSSQEIGTVRVVPFLWSELFTGHEQPLRNRASIGVGIELTEYLMLEVGYIRQDTRGKGALNVLNSGVHFSF